MSHTARCTTVLFVTKKALLATASLGILAAFSPASASDLLSFATTGSLSGWSTTGSVSTINTTDTLNLNGTPFHLTPATGEYMAKISPIGSSLSCNSSTSCAAVDSVLGVTGGTLSALFNPLATQNALRATNFGVLTESISLAAGSYTFYWSYAAGDYHPYNDGVLFAISGGAVQTVSVLAANGDGSNGGTGGGAQVGTVVVGDYGATQWTSQTVTVATTGTYQVSFAAYNWGDTDSSFVPTLYVGASAGTVTSGSSTPIDTNAAYYLASNLGSSVNPDFKGGTLRVDTTMATSTAFTVEAYAGNTIDSYGHNGLFSGVLSGAGGLTIKDTAGGGKVIFTGTNTYSGGTTINSGATLQLGNGTTTGSIVGNVLDNGSLIYKNSSQQTVAGVISGTGSVAITGSGYVIFASDNTYTGGTTIANGSVLQLGWTSSTSGSIVGDVLNDGTILFGRSDTYTYGGNISGSGEVDKWGTSSTLILTGTNTYTGLTYIGEGTLQIGSGGTTGSVAGDIGDDSALIFNRSDAVTYAGIISGTGSLAQAGVGTLILTGANSYTGGTTISAGTLQIGAGGTTGSVAGNIANNAALAFNRSDSITYAGVISGTGSLTQAGTGTLILTGSNTYTGGTTIAAGTLQIGDGNTSGSIIGNIVDNASLLFSRSDAITFADVISGSGSLTQAGTGTLILTGANSYSGGTTIAAGGTLQIGSSGTTGSVAGNITNNGALLFNRSNAVTFAGIISGTGSLTQAGTNTLTLTGANTYSGGTTIAAGTLQIGDGNTSGSIVGDVSNNGTLAFNRSDSITYAGVVSGTGSVTQAGAGTLILTGANTYTGGTTIAAGTLQIGAGGTTGSVAGNIANNAALAFKRSDSITYAGVVSGTGSLTQAGAGTLILTGANTYTGGTTITAGTLQIGNGGTTGSITGNIVDNALLVFNRSNSTTYNGVISGTGRLNVTGGGSLVLTGTNTYTGTTNIAAGSTLQIGNGGTTGSIVSDVANQGILAFNRSDTVTFNGNVTGDGTLVQNGTGKVIVTTNYTGKTIVNSGTLQIGNGSTSGTVTGNIVNNATVVYGQAATTTYSGVISGSGGVNVSGGGVVILNGTNTYTGPTTVSTGSLVIGDITHQNAVVSGNVTVNPTGIVGGYGTIGGNLVASGGIVSPGNSIGTLTVKGNYTQSAASTLAIELTPTANDQLVVTGTAQLGGTLSLSLASGSYTTRSYTLLTASAVNGTFASVTYSGANSDMVYGIAYKATEVDLAMTPQASGQIYGDIITATLDTAVVLNRTTLDRLNSTSNTGWSVWSKTLAGASRTVADNGLANFNSQLWGVISGVDYSFASGPKLSAVFSYTHNQLGVHGENDKAGTNGYFFSLAGHYAVEPVTVDVTGFIQANDVDVTRADANAGTVLAQTHNLVGGGSVQIGYPLRDGEVLPFARLTVVNFDGDGFSETGALGLSVNAVTRTSVRGSWGVQVHHSFATENGTQIQPHFVIGLENEFGQRRRNLAMTFTGTAFDAPAPMPASFSALLGAGVSAKLEQCLELSLESNARLSGNQQEGILSFGAKYRF